VPLQLPEDARFLVRRIVVHLHEDALRAETVPHLEKLQGCVSISQKMSAPKGAAQNNISAVSAKQLSASAALIRSFFFQFQVLSISMGVV